MIAAQALSMASMPSPADLFPPDPKPRHGVQCTVSRAPVDETSTLVIIWDVEGGNGGETAGAGRVRWASNGRMPIAGDQALMFIDSRGDAWALVWASGALIA